MSNSFCKLTTVCSAFLLLAGFSGLAAADPLFTDNFEDRLKDQVLIDNGWTWYNQTFADDTCSGELTFEWGPYNDGDGGVDYLQENRNYWTADEAVGEGNSYFRAGLEVPAWASVDGDPVVLSNMLKVYGDQYYHEGVTTCKRTLVFQEMDVASAGTFSFSFDVAMARYGAPANGEVTGAFVKVLRQSDSTWTTILFEKAETNPPVSSTPENATTARQAVDFTITPEMVGELLQFGFYTDLSENLGQSVDTSAALYDNIKVDVMEIGPAHSGSWYNGGQSGHGFSMEFGVLPDGSPFAGVYWYTYDDLGNPIFMLGNGIPVGNVVELTFESPVGMKYGEFDPGTVIRGPGGTGVIVFGDRDHATFSYTPSVFTETEWGHTTPITDLPLIKIFGIAADKNF